MTHTRATDEIIRAALTEGRLSAAQIGELVGKSRSAVLGRVRRRPDLFPMGFANREVGRIARAPGDRPTHESRRKSRRRAGPRDDAIAPQAYDAACEALPLEELADDGCKYPVNDRDADGEHLFCGRPAKSRSAYCAHHHARCHRDEGDEAEAPATGFVPFSWSSAGRSGRRAR